MWDLNLSYDIEITLKLHFIMNILKDISIMYSKTCLKRPLKNIQNEVLKTGGSLVQVESIAEQGHSAIILTCKMQLSVLKTYFWVFIWVTA